MPPQKVRTTLALNLALWAELTHKLGLETEKEQAEALGFSRGNLNRIRNGRSAPGPEFIAAVRAAWPNADTDKLFPVVEKSAS